MSNSSTNEQPAPLGATLPDVSESLIKPIRGIAFWTAIALPFLHVPLLLSGLDSGSTRAAFLALLACNALALLVGHSYRSS
jgi:hypothetical protein